MSQAGSQVNLDAPGPDKYTEVDVPSSGRSVGDLDISDPSQPLITSSNTPRTPADKVRFILAEQGSETEAESEIGLNAHSLFCQLDELIHFDDDETGWKEMARWIKYEEKVEEGDRWSKPHVATTSLHALFEIRKAIADNTAIVDLDLNASHNSIHQVAEILVEQIAQSKKLSQDKLDRLIEIITKPHKHKHRKGDKDKLEAKVEVANETNSNEGGDKKKKKKFVKKDDLAEVSMQKYKYPGKLTPDDLKPYKPNKRLLSKIPKGSEVANVLIGQVDFLDEPIVALIRLRNGSLLGDMTEVSLPTRFIFLVLGPPDASSIWEYEEVGRAMASLFSDKVFCEVAYKAASRQDIVDGIDEYIDELTVLPPSIWDPTTRLEPPQKTRSDDKIRKRLQKERYGGPNAISFADAISGDSSLEKTGTIFGGMIRDMKSRYSYYLSDIKDGLSVQTIASVVFLYFACITPIVTFGGLLGTATDGQMGTMECLLSGAICGITFALFSGQPLTIMGATGPLLIFESIMYTICKDNSIDFLSFRFWTGVWITAILVIMVVFDLSYLVKYITRFTEESFSVLISLIFIAEAFKKVIHVMDKSPLETDTLYRPADYVCHCIPSNITNSTGTILDGIEATTLPAINGSEAPEYLKPLTHWYNWTTLVADDCINYHHEVAVKHGCITEKDCEKYGWTLSGDACNDYSTTHAVPDVFFVCLCMFFLTFGVAYSLRLFRTARCFPSIVRNTVADFGVLISILIACGVDYALGLSTPKLMVPTEFKTTVDGRGWVVNPMNILPMWYAIILALIPALLATILIFLDQQITAVIINRKDHKLKKPPGYHLDLFVLAVLIFVCSLLGLPWFVAATVRSITHVKSLFKQSEIKAPGERPSMLGVREQRVTGFLIHVLIGVSVLMTGILRYVPMAVLYGVFLYMGVTSLTGVQFVDRIRILFMPAKFQPDLIFLRHVSLKRVHIFTVIQIILMALMWFVKSVKSIAIAFPLLILALCFVRKGMDYYFTQGELFWLDHLLPEADRRKKEDDLIEEIKAEGYDSDTEPLTAWPEKDEKKEQGNKKKPGKPGSVGKYNSRERLQRRPKV